MRWISIATVLSAALLPAASARPRCHPAKPTTTSGAPTTTAIGSSIGTLSTDTATTLETFATYETTSAFETTVTESESATTTDATSAFETTITDSTTSTSGITTELETSITASETATATTDATTTNFEATIAESATTAETTDAEVTTTATTEAAETTNLIENGNFEEIPNMDWSFRGSEIKTSSQRARSPNNYAEFKVEGTEAVGSNQLNQTLHGLSTDRLYRLSFFSTAFSSAPFPTLDGQTACDMEAYQGGSKIYNWAVDIVNLNLYMPYDIDFTPDNEDFELSLRLRCTSGHTLSIAVGVDDVSMIDVGAATPTA
ncbi:hypothetical protein F53441_10467 [Fusarium austroafricanum]|uniref:CBM-cenC domain-containing protein n=1 Tax=Fusarium austroafricanum TaxID=2364996 RepID=A0A8H4K6V4_9HYPO|nr:hypothetical protein F53441_10467 [Fusarium austroafricanum]